MAVAAVELAGNISGNAHTRGCRTGVGHCARDVGGAGSAVVDCRDGGRRASALVCSIGVTKRKVLDKVGKRHGGGVSARKSGMAGWYFVGGSDSNGRREEAVAMGGKCRCGNSTARNETGNGLMRKTRMASGFFIPTGAGCSKLRKEIYSSRRRNSKRRATRLTLVEQRRLYFPGGRGIEAIRVRFRIQQALPPLQNIQFSNDIRRISKGAPLRPRQFRPAATARG